MENKDIRRSLLPNMVWYVKDILEDNGYSSSEYSIDLSYPNNEDTYRVKPMLGVQLGPMVSKPFQLGSKARQVNLFYVFVVGPSRSQIIQILDLLWDQLNETVKTFYDMSSAEPSVVGDYSGLSSAGKLIINNGESDMFSVPIYKKDKLENYEGVVRFQIEVGMS